jgi:hypothetical protein
MAGDGRRPGRTTPAGGAWGAVETDRRRLSRVVRAGIHLPTRGLDRTWGPQHLHDGIVLRRVKCRSGAGSGRGRSIRAVIRGRPGPGRAVLAGRVTAGHGSLAPRPRIGTLVHLAAHWAGSRAPDRDTCARGGTSDPVRSGPSCVAEATHDPRTRRDWPQCAPQRTSVPIGPRACFAESAGAGLAARGRRFE